MSTNLDSLESYSTQRINNIEISALDLILARLDQIEAQLACLIDNRPPRYLSVKSAALLLDVSEDTLRKRIERRQITSYKDEQGQLRIRIDDLERSLTKYPRIDEIQ